MKEYCGVYSLCIAGRRYIGASQHIELRWQKHLIALRNGCHSNTRLQEAFNTHGESCVECTVLQICPPHLLDSAEIAHIKQHDSTNPEKGFNLRCGGRSGYSISPDTLAKMAKTRRKGVSQREVFAQILADLTKGVYDIPKDSTPMSKNVKEIKDLLEKRNTKKPRLSQQLSLQNKGSTMKTSPH
jgi:group I intron endonuclease